MSHSPKGELVFLGTKGDYVPDDENLRNRILEESHGSRYSIYLGATKIYHDLRDIFVGGMV